MKKVGGAVASPSISFRVFTITTLFHGFYRKSALGLKGEMRGGRGKGDKTRRLGWEGEMDGIWEREKQMETGMEKAYGEMGQVKGKGRYGEETVEGKACGNELVAKVK